MGLRLCAAKSLASNAKTDAKSFNRSLSGQRGCFPTNKTRMLHFQFRCQMAECEICFQPFDLEPTAGRLEVQFQDVSSLRVSRICSVFYANLALCNMVGKPDAERARVGKKMVGFAGLGEIFKQLDRVADIHDDDDPNMLVVYASGYSAEMVDKNFFLEAGVNFISKPFEAKKLAKIIRDCLDAHPQPERK
jgi:hypothetical protein